MRDALCAMLCARSIPEHRAQGAFLHEALGRVASAADVADPQLGLGSEAVRQTQLQIHAVGAEHFVFDLGLPFLQARLEQGQLGEIAMHAEAGHRHDRHALGQAQAFRLVPP